MIDVQSEMKEYEFTLISVTKLEKTKNKTLPTIPEANGLRAKQK